MRIALFPSQQLSRKELSDCPISQKIWFLGDLLYYCSIICFLALPLVFLGAALTKKNWSLLASIPVPMVIFAFTFWCSVWIRDYISFLICGKLQGEVACVTNRLPIIACFGSLIFFLFGLAISGAGHGSLAYMYMVSLASPIATIFFLVPLPPMADSVSIAILLIELVLGMVFWFYLTYYLVHRFKK